MIRTSSFSAPSAWLTLMLMVAVGLSATPGAAPAYTVSGQVTFQGLSQQPYPIATVVIVEHGTSNVVTTGSTDPTDGRFSLTGIDDGHYAAHITAPCWSIGTVEDFWVSGGNGGLGIINLTPTTSSFTTIQLAGDFIGWDLGSLPFMTFEGSCTWVDTVTIQPGTYACKFITDGDYDNPPSYGGDENQTLSLPGGPYNTWLVTGQGTAITVEVAVAGDYIFTLNESLGSFSVEFDGTLPEGSLSGAIIFAGITEAPFPVATVKLLEGGSSTVLRTTTSDPTTRQFTFTPLEDGSYDLEISSACFVTQTVAGITISGGPLTLSATHLAAGASPFTSIRVVGDFTGWDIPGSPAMTQDPACRWETSALITAGTYYFKFITGDAWGNDYGGDQSVVLTAPGTYSVDAGVSGDRAIKMTFPAEDTYTFILDEAAQTFTVTETVPVERVTWGTLKTRY